jgi:hypothetical protein
MTIPKAFAKIKKTIVLKTSLPPTTIGTQGTAKTLLNTPTNAAAPRGSLRKE